MIADHAGNRVDHESLRRSDRNRLFNRRMMADSVKLIECPRDAWQGLKGQIPADLKVNYLQALISAGFKHIDAVSFVSPNAVPQMADSEEVLKELDPPDDVEIIGIVVNEKGAQRADQRPRPCARWVFPIRSRRLFCRTINGRRWKTPLRNWRKSRRKPTKPGSTPSSTFRWPSAIPTATPGPSDEVVEAVGLLELQEIRTISLADTVGLAPPEKIREVVSAVMAKYDYLEIGVHLHSRPDAGRRQNSSQPMKPVVAASILPSAVSVDVLSRRMTWSEIFPRKKQSKPCATGRAIAGAQIVGRIVAERSAEIGARYKISTAAD